MDTRNPRGVTSEGIGYQMEEDRVDALSLLVGSPILTQESGNALMTSGCKCPWAATITYHFVARKLGFVPGQRLCDPTKNTAYHKLARITVALVPSGKDAMPMGDRELGRIVGSLSNTAPGLDGISSRIIKHV
ncbi:hypothetical protein EVAR_17387_1 [Eumeta japonica]|uniref:Uncharacterized protein n=1 Tax=Eumeta variegata TaxID=151549 RepID=A0A4C1VA27_EUMVA|nr:hypothetical protein EVAR_17387_1 [Eumeta japonica]